MDDTLAAWRTPPALHRVANAFFTLGIQRIHAQKKRYFCIRRPYRWRYSPSLCSTSRAALAGDQNVVGLLGCDSKALLFHVGDRTLLHGIEPIAQSATAIDGVGELVTYIIVDLGHRRPPLEVDIDVLGRLAEDLVDHLIAIERLRTVHGGRA